MREAIAAFAPPHGDYEPTPAGLERLIHTLRKEHGMNAAADALGYSRSTVTSWLKKLEAFRQFAGQSPEAILVILGRVAEQRGIDEAADLILIDPRTLEQALARFTLDKAA